MIEVGSGARGRTERNGRDERDGRQICGRRRLRTCRSRQLDERRNDAAGRQQHQEVVQIDKRLDGAIRISRLPLLGGPGAHRTHFPGMRALRAALMGARATGGCGQRLLTAERCRNEDLHDHVAQHHGQPQRREMPSDGSHRLSEIILQTSASRVDLPPGTVFAMTLRIPVIYGSVRSGRQGIKVARFVERQLRGRGHEVTLVNPLQEQLPLLERRFKDYPPGTAPAALERLAGLYRQADAFVIVSGEYNHSVPPALTNLLDHFLEEYLLPPVGHRELLERRICRSSCHGPASRDAVHSRHAQHSRDVPGAKSAGCR